MKLIFDVVSRQTKYEADDPPESSATTPGIRPR